MLLSAYTSPCFTCWCTLPVVYQAHFLENGPLDQLDDSSSPYRFLVLAQVNQEYLVVPKQNLVHTLMRVLDHTARSDPDHKAIVFFPTAMMTK